MDTKNLISLIFFLQSISNAVSVPIAQKPGLGIIHQSFMCSKKGELTSADIVDRERALGRLLKNILELRGTEIGQGDRVWSTALCPTNIKLEACRECVNKTNTYLKDKCPKQKEGVAWTVFERVICVVRYADVSYAGKLSEWAYATFPSPPNQSPYSLADLEKEFNNLANKLKGAVSNDRKRYGSGSVTFGPGRTLYGSMQCTYGIDEANCMKCLSDITNRVRNCCSKQRSLSGIAASTDCYFWYQHNNFLP